MCILCVLCVYCIVHSCPYNTTVKPASNLIPAHSPELLTHRYNEWGGGWRGQSRWRPVHASPSTRFLRRSHNSFIAALVRTAATLCELFLVTKPREKRKKNKKTGTFFAHPPPPPALHLSGTPWPLQPGNVPYKKKMLVLFFKEI